MKFYGNAAMMPDNKPQNNADRIRAMSDEELAHELADVWDCHKCSEYDRLDGHPLLKAEQCDQECEKHCLEWLKQPAEGENNVGKSKTELDKEST